MGHGVTKKAVFIFYSYVNPRDAGVANALTLDTVASKFAKLPELLGRANCGGKMGNNDWVTEIIGCAGAAALVGAIGSTSYPAEATSPSFDCRKAGAPDEIAICQESVLADIDVLISKAFGRYASEFRPKDDVGGDYLAD